MILAKHIKNPHYRKFLDEGMIDVIDESMIRRALANISGNRTRQGRSLLIALYYTGARPNEVLRIQAKDIKKEGRHITVALRPSKRGLPRNLYFKDNDLMRELYTYASVFPADFYIFSDFRGSYTRTRQNKKGEWKQRTETADKLRYYVYKWFKDIVPNSITTYFLRHNRFSKMAIKGASIEDIRFWKGGRTLNSVTPYVHMSSSKSKQISKKVD